MKPMQEHLTESLSYEVVVTDKEGREIFREAGPSHSYTELWNKVINAHARMGSNTLRLPEYCPTVRLTPPVSLMVLEPVLA